MEQTLEVMDPATGFRMVLARFTERITPRSIVLDPTRG